MLAAPAMRIRVSYSLCCKKRAAFLHIVYNCVTGFLIIHSCILSRIGSLISFVINRYYNIHFITHTRHIVVCSESGRGMNASGTAFHSDIFGAKKNRISVKERMTCFHIFEVASDKGSYNLITVYSSGFHCIFTESLGKNICLSV